jgi:hypothetical protein
MLKLAKFCASLICVTFIIALSDASATRIGSLRLVTNPERTATLQLLPGGGGALTDFAYVGRVGGIAFEAVISLPPPLDSGNFQLAYTAESPDGRRASISTKGRRYIIRLFDWQLRPIAEFADSPYTGVVTLFGDGPDQDNNFYVDYHRAFKNKLIGLRLLQADMILMAPEELSQMPEEDNGKVEIGPGEVPPQAIDRIAAAKRIKIIMSKSSAHSWVLTDVDAPLKVFLKNGKVVVEGRPYYYFWRAERSSSTQDERVNPQTEVTQAIDRKWDDLLTMNRPVYQAVLNTSRYAALFRALKAANSEQWHKFLTLVTAINVNTRKIPNEILKPKLP